MQMIRSLCLGVTRATIACTGAAESKPAAPRTTDADGDAMISGEWRINSIFICDDWRALSEPTRVHSQNRPGLRALAGVPSHLARVSMYVCMSSLVN